ncbi:hypothetical protein BH10BAC2_BH10BAC2_02160 [soil metagenome]
MKFLLITSLLFTIINSYSQCSTYKVVEQSITVIANKPEKIYQNEDLENGAIIYHLEVYQLFKNENPTELSYGLESFYTYFNTSREIVPRAFIFSFKDGTLLRIISTKEDPKTENFGDGYKRRRFSYSLTKENLSELSTKEILSITITDNRTNQSIQATPYGSFLKEQIGCLPRN